MPSPANTAMWAVFLAAATLAAGRGLAQEPAADGPRASQPDQRAPLLPSTAERLKATPEQVARWVEQLDADEFLTRDTAMLRLIEAGPAALPVVVERLPGASVEASARSLYILRQLGLSDDFQTQERAWAALSEAAERREFPALARRASSALDQLRQERAAHAQAELEALGAEFKLPTDLVFALDPVPVLELGDSFRGQIDDLRRLKWLADAPRLALAGDKVTDEWLPHVAAMPNLSELHLYQTKVSDEGLAAMAGSARLQQVGLYYTPLGDKALEPLKTLPALRFVKLYGTRATADGVKALEDATSARIDHRRGAFLGVGGSDLAGSCLIGKVHPGSPAEKAKLAVNDVIVRFGDGKVTTFDTLTALISRREAGEEVEVEVLRQTIDDDGNTILRPVTVKATLAPWQLTVAVFNGPR